MCDVEIGPHFHGGITQAESRCLDEPIEYRTPAVRSSWIVDEFFQVPPLAWSVVNFAYYELVRRDLTLREVKDSTLILFKVSVSLCREHIFLGILVWFLCLLSHL